MLEVIRSRGLPLDRITTTDVWATDTISANLPPMEEFKDRMDNRIWDMYRIEVEHLCARNPDGTKRTYEQMFYHVPVRKSGGVQTRDDSWISRPLDPVVSICTQAECQATEFREPLPDSHRTPGTTGARSSSFAGGRTRDSHWQRELLGARNSKQERNQGFPAQISPWCRKLKIDKVKTPFPLARHDGQIEISWNILASLPMSQPGSAS